MTKRIALLMTYAYPDEENRLKTQLAELLRMGFEVHTLGFGGNSLEGVLRHFEIPRRQSFFGLARVALIHLTLPVKKRFGMLRVPPEILNDMEEQSYDLAIAHDLELLPLLLDEEIQPPAIRSAVKQVDLHELHEFRPTMTGIANLAWKILSFRMRPYHEWLMAFLRSKNLGLATVVNQSIGAWYVRNGYLRDFVEVVNTAPYQNLAFEARQGESLNFVYHGKFEHSRGLEQLVIASLGLRPGDRLNFMLTGRKRDLNRFKAYALEQNPQISFHEAVPMEQVSLAIAKFDAEVIYTVPLFKNRRFTLPNKFFEAIQGRLAIVSGPNPELVRFTGLLNNGIATSRWDIAELSTLLASLDRPTIEKMRQASHQAAGKWNAATEAEKLQQAWNRLLPSV